MATKRSLRSSTTLQNITSTLSSTTPTDLGTILITGGCGFIGSHIVSGLLSTSNSTSTSSSPSYNLPSITFSSIHVLSRSPTSNLHPGVSYHSIDITSYSSLLSLFKEIKPTTVIHASAPSPTTGTTKMFRKVTIEGTKNLLEVSREVGVKAFVYTSSSTMAAGMEHVELREEARLADTERFSHPYAKTKAVADGIVLNFNAKSESGKEGVRTGCIRLPIVYGPGDPWGTPSSLEALRAGRTSIRLGNGKNRWSMCSISNAVLGHILLAKHLLLKTSNVDGEAFHIHDGHDIVFWEFPRGVWKAAGGNPPAIEDMIGIPAVLLLVIAFALEWIYWIGTFGQMRPQLMGLQQVQYTCFDHTYSIEKARKRLWFQPQGTWEEGVQEGVDWQLDHAGWREKLKGKVKEN